ncbi:rCG54264 [Rattus norvegicus]|uniref:RCG54264 n=1 Tax=Rattus norvegicus TaxID=10116 RepID=A6J9A2_RAT|nr:rCG54264 [Rattus norvegicus]
MGSLSSQVFELFSGFLKYFPGVHKQISKNLQEILNYIDHSVEKHRATLDPNTPRDFINTYLLRMEKESAFVLEKALPKMNCSFSSPPSSRTSLWQALWLLRTLTSVPLTVV